MAFRRVEAFGLQVLLVIELEAGIFLEVRGDGHALRRELALGIPVRQVDLELRMRLAEVLHVVEAARVLRVRFQVGVAVRAQALIAAHESAQALVILVARATFRVAEFGQVEFDRIGVRRGIRMAGEARVVAHRAERGLVALRAVLRKEVMRGIDRAGIPAQRARQQRHAPQQFAEARLEMADHRQDQAEQQDAREQ